MKHIALILSIILALPSLVTPAQAGQVPFGPELEAQGWKPLTFRSLTPMQFSANGTGQLGISGTKAASLIWRGLDESEWQARTANWRWRVDSGPPATDLAIKGKDDRAIALYFVFAKDDAAARAAKGSSSLSSAMWWSSGAALVYVWGGAGARNAVIASPHMGSSGKLILRQPGNLADGRWQLERADLIADFRRAFGREPGPLVGIAISSDNDDTASTTKAAIEALNIE